MPMTTQEQIGTVLTVSTLDTLVDIYWRASVESQNVTNNDTARPQSRTFKLAHDAVMPAEMRILPDRETRTRLSELYYQNHYLTLPMVQREVLRVCEENIHIPHCLFLCNAVYYCGSITSTNLAEGEDDGEEFFLRGQDILKERYLGTHICTIQGLLLFANGNRTIAQRTGFVNQAINMARTIGIHTRQDESINSIMKAYLARVFWCCFIYDSTLSAIGGGPALINKEDVTVDMFEAGDLGSEGDTCSDQYMLHSVRGWLVYREIRNYYNQIAQGPQHSRQFLFNRLGQLDKSLVEWQEQLPIVLDIFPTKKSITSPIKAMATGAQLLCYSLIIFLHYPNLPDPKSSYTPLTGEQGGPPDSQGYCTQAAKEIIRIISILLEKAPWILRQDIAARYALNMAIRIHHYDSKVTYDTFFAREAGRNLQKAIVLAGETFSEHDSFNWESSGEGTNPRDDPMAFAFLPSGLEDDVRALPPSEDNGHEH